VEAWQAMALALAALLIGALLPAAVQLTLVLRTLRGTAARSDRALEAVTAAAERLERLAARLEDSASLASALGAAVGPAIGAAVRSWRASGAADDAGGANGAGASTARKEGDT
jgi:hypothetical protein